MIKIADSWSAGFEVKGWGAALCWQFVLPLHNIFASGS